MTETETVNFDTIGITDDIMFGSVFGIMEECKEFLERLLRIKIVELKVVEEQKSMRTKLAGKGIRIDVYARDVEGNSYDIEMQLTNTGDLDLRSRYYHSEMDGYQIRRGQKYKNLKESIVIFVCAFDPFKDNRSIYTFETICRENTAIVLEDKRKTFFVNINGDRTGLSEETVHLLDYFKTGKPTDDFTERLQQKVEEIRNDDEWRENYMTLEMKLDQRFEDGKKVGRAEGEKFGRAEGEKFGRAEGEKNRDKNLISKWLKKGKTVTEIAEDLEQPEEYVRELMK